MEAEARAGFERTCGDSCRLSSVNWRDDKIEFTFEVPALGRTFFVGVRPEGDEIGPLAERAGEHARHKAEKERAA